MTRQHWEERAGDDRCNSTLMVSGSTWIKRCVCFLPKGHTELHQGTCGTTWFTDKPVKPPGAAYSIAINQP